MLSTAYFAPIPYYARLASADSAVVLERHEHYNKQSYRNRCTICSANGMLDLVVPIAKSPKPKVPITEVRISYDTPWQKLHFKAVESAYRRSPFYEYYIDELSIFFDKRFGYLYDFNMQIMLTVCDLLRIPCRIRESESYMGADTNPADLRDAIHPKKREQIRDADFESRQYTQVFSDKFGFVPDLSILDLLFNTGPDAVSYLQKQP